VIIQRNINLVERIFVLIGIAGSITTAFATPTESRNAVQASEAQEQRYLFDEDLNWITTEQREKFLADVKAAGFNVIVPVVWRGIGVTWPSTLAPRDSSWRCVVGASTDPLKDLISRAHELGIKVIPWFTVAHRQRDFAPEFHEEGTPDKAFNVHRDEFRTFVVKLMMEVVERYDVDGINLDYVRAKGICKTRACRKHYASKTKRDLLQDAANMWKDKESGDSIARWNAEAVTRIIEDLSMQVRARGPNLPISVDSHPVAKWTYLEGASTIAWVNRGLIDMIFDMQYKRDIDVAAVNNAKSKLLDPAKYVLLVGNYEASPSDKQRVWARDASLVADLLRKSQLHSQNARAAALYEYRFLNNEQIQAISQGPFSPAGNAGSLIPGAES
jgi:uncharacterized lipoprotein YddW (UPF0748 family)